MSKRLLALLCMMTVAASLLTGCGGDNAQIGDPAKDTEKANLNAPRNETLFVTGMAWGPPDSFNWLSGYPTWPVNITSNPIVYETLLMYNNVTEKLEPLLAQSYAWKDDMTVEVKLNADAHFSDGQPVTSADVLYTFDLAKRYTILWSSYWETLDKIEAPDAQTVVFHLKKEGLNRMLLLESITRVPIHPKHIWEKIEKDNNYKIAELSKFFNDKPVGSGPYKVAFYDETRIILVRDDNYWGKKLYGKLPAPKKIVHLLFNSNDTATAALKNGDLDYTEDFIPHAEKLWADGTPIKTYLKEKPYYFSDTLPTIYINLHRKGLENLKVRQAIAYAINYKEIAEKAMSGYSEVIKPAVTTDQINEQKLVDQEAIKGLQWQHDAKKANEILDSLGAKRGADGIRVLPDGTRLGPWNIECPYGWTDWNASLEIVAQSCKEVGVEINTKFPEFPVYDNDKNTGNFDIIMDTPAAYISPANPWKRAHDLMSSLGVAKIGEQAFWNYGRYKNDRVDTVLREISNAQDDATKRKLYTELNAQYLKDIPSIPLMYRPTYFYTFSEKVWTGFTTSDSSSKNPPYLFDAAGIKNLYDLKAK